MRIQAGALENVGQFVRAIGLIERIEGEDADHFALAWLYESKASCYRHLGRNELAVRWYRAALERERKRRTVRGGASVEFPFWVATEMLEPLYDEAWSILLESIDPRGLFPITMFKQYAALALITAEKGHNEEAKPSARAALLYAERTQSNAAKHRSLGLVDGDYTVLKRKLRRIAEGKSPRGGRWRRLFNTWIRH